MLLAKANQERHINQRRNPAPHYKVADMVQLDTRNPFTKIPSCKLENRYAGKYSIKRVISPYVVKLELTPDLCVYSIFHVNLLEPAATEPIYLGHVELSRPLIKVDREIKYSVSVIVNSRLFRRAERL